MNTPTLDVSQYLADDRLPDGSTVHLRAIRPDDKQALQQALADYDPASSYQRFMGIKKSFSDAELIAYTEPDFIHHVALVAELDLAGRRLPVGVARYFTSEEGTSAEVAFAVHTDYQHHGLGTVLLRHLTRIARQAGIGELRAWVFADNRGMIGVFQRAPEPSSFRYRDNLIEVTLTLD